MLKTVSTLGKSQDLHYKKSLNSPYCRRVEKEIDDSNQFLVKRLQNANSEYSRKGFKKSALQYESVKSKMAN